MVCSSGSKSSIELISFSLVSFSIELFTFLMVSLATTSVFVLSVGVVVSAFLSDGPQAVSEAMIAVERARFLACFLRVSLVELMVFLKFMVAVGKKINIKTFT